MKSTELIKLQGKETGELGDRTGRWRDMTYNVFSEMLNPNQLECGPMPNVMVALPNIGGALCSTPQSLADAHYQMPCSNTTKMQNQWKFAGVPQTCKPISAASRPKFTILWGHVEDILLLNKFFSDRRYMPQLRRYSPTKLCDGAQMAIFGDFCVLCFQLAACSRFQTCILNLH